MPKTPVVTFFIGGPSLASGKEATATLFTDVDSPEVIECVRQAIRDLKTLILESLDDPAQWQDEFGQTIAYFGDLLVTGRIQRTTFERLCKERLTNG